jgi:hypothetical protein
VVYWRFSTFFRNEMDNRGEVALQAVMVLLNPLASFGRDFSM